MSTGYTIDVPKLYGELGAVLSKAIEQAAYGKGSQRHAHVGEPFIQQPICEVTRRLGIGFPLGQAIKKIYEGQTLDDREAIAEFLGAINYIAAAVIAIGERMQKQVPSEDYI